MNKRRGKNRRFKGGRVGIIAALIILIPLFIFTVNGVTTINEDIGNIVDEEYIKVGFIDTMEGYKEIRSKYGTIEGDDYLIEGDYDRLNSVIIDLNADGYEGMSLYDKMYLYEKQPLGNLDDKKVKDYLELRSIRFVYSITSVLTGLVLIAGLINILT